VIEREAPGIAEAMRQASREHTPHWMLSRGVAGIRGRTLIVNFPGSPASIDQAGTAISDALPHALALLSGGGAAGHTGPRTDRSQAAPGA
jgi:molybdopterin biosynthesis enzyme MoaB